jgi:16S rRNA G966 N2-methylase RsmD
MSFKVLEKIFPNFNDIDMEKLRYDSEGLYSISHPEDAEFISDEIKKFKGTTELNIFEGTAGLGGNIISFAKNFKSVTGVEQNEERFEILKNNMDCYNMNNIKLIKGNCLDYLNINYDVYFFDPPWGGPDYKSYNNLELYIGNKGIPEIIKLLPTNKTVVLKVPYNYNLNLLKEYDFIIKKLRNILIILINT